MKFIFAIISLFFITDFSHAATNCVLGDAGKMRYSPSDVMEFCNGTLWRSMKGTVSTSCVIGSIGTIRYSSSKMQFCNGTSWFDMKGAVVTSCLPAEAGKNIYNSNTMQFCDGSNWYDMSRTPAAGWTSQTTSTAEKFNGFFKVGDYYVASQYTKIIASDNLAAWDVSSYPAGTSNPNLAVALISGVYKLVLATYGGNGFYGASYTTGALPSSLTWTPMTGTGWVPPANLSAYFDYGNGRFVGMTNDYANSTISTDGTTWTAGGYLDSPSFDYVTWSGMRYGNGIFVIKIAGGGPNGTTATSPDGTTWTARTTGVAGNWSRPAFGNGQFVMVNSVSSNIFLTSPDGITWTQRTVPTTGVYKSVAYGNGRFIAPASGTAVAMTSTNGTTWTSVALPKTSAWDYVGFADDLFILTDSTATFYTSP